ncbi:MAG: DUF504 domain-containing protein [Desulfobacteraceae bacterium]|nr:DUF504 domain-containing protein [Desulfobacteraceae bacterium]
MLPIRKLLSRIRWDREFGQGEFEIGYEDRVAGEIVRVPFRELVLDLGVRESFGVLDQEGVFRRIPFHRVREVYRNGKCIWKRPAR